MRRAIVLDTETTGLSAATHHVIEIAFRLVDLETGHRVAEYERVIHLTCDEWVWAAPGALAVNNFTWGEVMARGVPRDTVYQEIRAFFAAHELSGRTAFFLCQNPTFDRAFFAQLVPVDVQRVYRFPYHWYDLASMNWAIEARAIARGEQDPYAIAASKDAIAAGHGIDAEASPHRAMNGVDHLLQIYEKIVGFRPPQPRRSPRLQAK